MALSLTLMLIITGCSSQPAASQQATAKKTTLTVAQGTDLISFDPGSILDSPSDSILRNINSRLYKRNAKGEVSPELVENATNTDPSTWRMTLKKGIKFQNGDELTAKDVKFTLERLATDKKLIQNPYFNRIKGVKIIDDYTFDIITDGPMPTLKSVLAKSGSDILPKDYIEKNGWDNFQQKPIGAGPYQVVERIKDDRLVLKPFANYFAGKVTNWEQVVFRSIPETSTRVSELLTSGVDIATNIPSNEWQRVSQASNTSLVNGDTTRVMLLVVRGTPGTVTADPKVREAIDLAIDKQKLIQLVGGAGIQVRTRVPAGVVGSNPDLINTSLYDKEKAKQLLKDAGYPNGIELTLQAPKGRYTMDAEIAEMVGGMLNDVGIKTKVEVSEWSKFLDVYNNKKNKELTLIALADDLLDASYSLVHYTKDRAKDQTDYYNPEVENLYKLAGENMNPDERVKQYQRIQAIVAEERPHIYLFQMKANYGVAKNIDFAPRIDETVYIPDVKLK
jgi:peptide/nickel transport system substrate-binding protein